MNYPPNSLIRTILILSVCTLFFISIGKMTAHANPSELFFSEYIEGSSFNKALEIYNDTEHPDPAAPELLLSELVVSPTAGEFIEIHNPTGETIDLTNVYLTDATFANGGVFYYNISTGSNAGGGGFSDFHARFPAGATIAAGEYQTIALAGSDNFQTTYGSVSTYELFEDGVGPDTVPDMIEALPGSINNQGGLTNDGEVVVLYFWDEAKDRVTDIDYALWGDKAEAVDKTGVSIDGPDVDTDTSPYFDDTAIASQDTIAAAAHAFGNSWQREDLAEGAETPVGGNGVGGDNETSEDLSNTWCENVPTPGSASDCPTTGGELGLCGESATLIHIVQGNGLLSAEAGNLHIIEGVVVGDYQNTTTELRGFFVQEEDAEADADITTSEGIFVFDNGFGTDVNVGDVVRVLGTVMEFEISSNSGVFLTELSNISDMAICSSGNSVTPATVNLPVGSLTEWEQYEGMLIHIPQELTVTEHFNLGRFGQVDLSSHGRLFNPTHLTTPGAAANAQQDLNNRSRITLDDANTQQNIDPTLYPASGLSAANTLRTGSTLNGVMGVLDNRFSAYRIQPVGVINFVDANPRQAMPNPVGGTLKVASLNVLNYFTTIDTGARICGPSANLGCRGADSADELSRQRAKIISAIVDIDSDIIGLVELENHLTDVPLQDLVDGLNVAMGAGTYAFINTGPVGTDAIKVALLYKPATVTPAGPFTVLDSSVDPLFIDTKNRPVVAQTFDENATGARFTVAVNHLKSKGSPCDDVGDPNMGDGQGNCNKTRTDAATAMVNWLATDPTGSGDPDVLIIGDLNAYALEDPITVLRNAGYTDLLKSFLGSNAYSFVFAGQFGYLDYALSSDSLTPQVTGVTGWHINADEPRVLDYNTEFKTPNHVNTLYASDSFRASDHDPVIVGLNLTAPKVAPAIYVSSSTSGHVAGMRFQDEDILEYNPEIGIWSMLFDGSDVGLRRVDVNAFHLLPDGSILMSFNRDVTLSGLGKVEDSDIYRFIPTSLGPDTSGSFELLFDGSDVGLSKGSREEINAIGFTPDGRLVISTLGAVTTSTPGVSGFDSDMFVFNETSLGENTSGTWEKYVDGSDVGLSARFEDIWGTWIDGETNEIYLTARRSFSVDGGLRGDSDDIFICTPISLGDDTDCHFSLFWDGDTSDFGGERIDGFAIAGPIMTSASVVASGAITDEASGQEINDDSDAHDDVDEQVDEDDIKADTDTQVHLYLPLVIE